MNEYRPLARRDDLIVRVLADEVLLYDRRHERAHCLNRTASLVWECCDGRSSIAEIAQKLAAPAGVAVDVEVVRFAGPNQFTVTGPNAASYSRRSMSRIHGITKLRWYSSLRVIGFDVFGGRTRLNRRIITSRTFWYHFSTRHLIRHLRIVAVWPAPTGREWMPR